MIIYLVCFIFVIIFSIINKSRNKIKRFLSAAMIILLPSILAGLRDLSIGTDVTNYVLTYFNLASHTNNIFAFIGNYSKNIEEGFLLLTFISAKFTNNLGWLLFFISFFIQFFVYLSLNNVRKENSIVIGEIIYLFLFYNESLNLMRQSMACALILYGFSFLLKEKNYKKYFILQFIAYFFHRSSILAIPLPILFYLFTTSTAFRESQQKLQTKIRVKFWIRLILVVIAMAFGVALFGTLIQVATSLGIINEHFQSYSVNQYGGIGSGRLMILYSASFIVPFIQRNKKNFGYVYLAIFLCEIIMFPLQGYLVWFNRVSRYFMYIRIFSLSNCNVNLFRIFHKSKLSKEELLYFIGIGLCIFYWVWIIVINNNNETIPYIFNF